MPPEGARLSELTSLLGAAANIIYLQHIFRRPSRSLLEARLVFLLICLTFLFVVRSIYWETGGEVMHTLVLIPSTLIPLAITLFVEALRRRHAPPVIKLAVATGTVVGIVMNFATTGEKGVFFPFIRWFTIGTFTWAALALFFRRRESLSAMENRFVDSITVACGLGVLFAMTDFTVRPTWAPFQLGGLGSLIFVYACVRLTNSVEKRLRVLYELGRLVVGALAITVAYALLAGERDITMYLAVFLLSLSFNVLFRIMARLRALRLRSSSGTSFYRWLLNAPMSSFERFMQSLHTIPWAVHPIVLRAEAFASYDQALMSELFDDKHPYRTLSSLRRAIEDNAQEHLPGAEQLVDLLETREMTHVAMLGRHPLVLLLANLPDLPGSDTATLEFALLQKYSRLLAAEELMHA